MTHFPMNTRQARTRLAVVFALAAVAVRGVRRTSDQQSEQPDS